MNNYKDNQKFISFIIIKNAESSLHEMHHNLVD